MKHPTINDTILLVAEIHQGQADKLGAPYFLHPMRVMMRLGAAASEAEKHAALLHDAMEDHPDKVTPGRLRELGYAEDVITMSGLLTRSDDETYAEFIDRIIASGSRGAMRVKLGDLYDNSDDERAAGAPADIRSKFADMAEKRYRPAIAKLKLALGVSASTVIAGSLHAPWPLNAAPRRAAMTDLGQQDAIKRYLAGDKTIFLDVESSLSAAILDAGSGCPDKETK